MGLDGDCTLSYDGRESAGRAHLDADRVTFRGGFRATLKFTDLVKTDFRGRNLLLRTATGKSAVLTFDEAKTAERWALKIRYPRKLIDKLGVKPEHRVTVLGVDDAAFDAALADRAEDVKYGRLRKHNDVIFLAIEKEKDLTRLPTLEAYLAPDGMVWAVWPKGRKALTGNHVRRAAREAGLVDVKVCSFSETLSALKLMIPKARRDI